MKKYTPLIFLLLIIAGLGLVYTAINTSNTIGSVEKVIGSDGSSVDSFGNLLARNMRTQLDIASQYQFNPERLRLFLNGNREFVQYGDYNQEKFEDSPDTWDMKPGAGDTMHIESAESATYNVGGQMSAAFAFQINHSLQNTGDYIRVGPYTGSDGWYMEHEAEDPNSSVVDIYSVRNGTRTLLQEDVVMPKPVTGFHMYEIEFNWYNVGEQVWKQTYINDEGEQVNQVFARTGLQDVKGPARANVNLWYEVGASGSTSDLEFEAGSVTFKTDAGADQLVREKPQHVEVDVPAVNDVWHPVYAIKLEEGTPVNAVLKNLQITDYSNDAEVAVQVVSVSPSKTDAANFSIPSYHHKRNSVLRDTFDVSTVPNRTGVEVDPGSTGFESGGFTLAAADLHPSGKDFKTGAVSSRQSTVKRQILSSDYAVFLVKSSNAGGTVHFDYVVKQEY